MADYTSTSARAARGALLLDSELPGWMLHVRAVHIDMESRTHCVLGQLARNDPRVRERVSLILDPGMARSACDTYRAAALAVFRAWPLAQTLYDHGFDGSVWALMPKSRVNLLDGAWFAQIELRGGVRAGRQPKNPFAEVDAPHAA